MTSEFNPDLKEDRQLALVEIIIAVKDQLSSIKGWEKPIITKKGLDTAIAKYPEGITEVSPALLNKLVLSISKLGWKTETLETDRIVMRRQEVATKVELAVSPETETPFIIKFI